RTGRDRLEVLAGRPLVLRGSGPALRVLRKQAAAPELLELRSRRGLLREHRGLDPMEEAFEPADELGLRDSELGFGRHRILDRGRERRELLAEIAGENVGELAHRPAVDLGEPLAPRLIERRLPRLVEEFSDHARDPKELRGLGDRLGSRRRSLLGLRVDRDRLDHAWRRDLTGVWVHPANLAPGPTRLRPTTR